MTADLDPDSPFGVLLECVSKNTSLIKLDLRHCNIPPALEKKLSQIPKHRSLEKRGVSVEAYEKV